MKVSEAKRFVGKKVIYNLKDSVLRSRTAIIEEVKGKNIVTDNDVLWAPDIVSMKILDGGDQGEK